MSNTSYYTIVSRTGIINGGTNEYLYFMLKTIKGWKISHSSL